MWKIDWHECGDGEDKDTSIAFKKTGICFFLLLFLSGVMKGWHENGEECVWYCVLLFLIGYFLRYPFLKANEGFCRVDIRLIKQRRSIHPMAFFMATIYVFEVEFPQCDSSAGDDRICKSIVNLMYR